MQLETLDDDAVIVRTMSRAANWTARHCQTASNWMFFFCGWNTSQLYIHIFISAQVVDNKQYEKKTLKNKNKNLTNQ